MRLAGGLGACALRSSCSSPLSYSREGCPVLRSSPTCTPRKAKARRLNFLATTPPSSTLLASLLYLGEPISSPCGALLLTPERYTPTKIASTINERMPGGSSHPSLSIGRPIVRLSMYMKNAPPAITTPRGHPHHMRR